MARSQTWNRALSGGASRLRLPVIGLGLMAATARAFVALVPGVGDEGRSDP